MKRLCLVLVLAASGCALVDQTTFAPSPEAKAQEAAAARPAPTLDARAPLVTIDYEVPNPSYRDLLAYAVRAAETRYRNVQYDVVAIMPSADQAAEAGERAAAVMRAIMLERVPDSRIHIGVRIEPAVATQQVRVYVR